MIRVEIQEIYTEYKFQSTMPFMPEIGQDVDFYYDGRWWVSTIEEMSYVFDEKNNFKHIFIGVVAEDQSFDPDMTEDITGNRPKIY